MVEKGLACGGQFDAVHAAVHKLNADLVFEIADLAAEGRLRRVQPFLKLPLPGLSPVSGKTVITKFDGGLLSSDGGVMALREVEQRQKALAGEDRGALLKNSTMNFKAPATRQKIKARCTDFYGGNSLWKAMPRRTKLCYGCRLGTIVLHDARHQPHDRQHEAPDPARPA
jgi:hypothetical protein